MANEDANMSLTLGSVQEPIRECHIELKSRAALPNLTSISPIMPSETRWSRNFLMVHDLMESEMN